LITLDAKEVANGISGKVLKEALDKHAKRAGEMGKLRDYYDGKHAILQRSKTAGTSNEKIVVNHAKYITDLASAYLIGGPIGYADAGKTDARGEDAGQEDAALNVLLDAYKRCNIDTVDAELAKHAGIYGRGAELAYMDAAARPRTAAVDPRYAFVVYDDTVAHEPLFGVHRVTRQNAHGEAEGETVTVYTAQDAICYARKGADAAPVLQGVEPHYFGGVPLTEYWNNEDERGDFEPVLTLIDAYNLLTSDRVNDKEQLVDALLMISGVTLGDTDDEFNQAVRRLRDQRILEMPTAGASAAYLTKQLNEGDAQVLADALARDIHKIAMVPALTDDQFAQSASGVAMKFKLLGLEQLTKTKERWFREGLRSRMRLFVHVLGVKGAPALDPELVQMTFSRGLPVNDLEQAQMIAQLQGIVPDKVLLRQLSFVDDPATALVMLTQQREEQAQRDGVRFGQYADANQRGQVVSQTEAAGAVEETEGRS